MKAYFVYCSTGCTCCNYENHFRGPFSSLDITKKKIKEYRECRILSSQYSANGNYSIKEVSETEIEQLPDGRLIIENRVYSSFKDSDSDDRDSLQD